MAMHRASSVSHSIGLAPLLIGFLLVLSSLPLPAHAQNIIEHRFVSRQPDVQLEDSLYLTAGIELSAAGFSSTREAGHATYVLLTEYAIGTDGVAVKYTLSLTARPEQPLAETEVLLRLDDSFDSGVAAAVRYVLDTAAIMTARSGPSNIAGLLLEPSNEAEAPTAAPAPPRTHGAVSLEAGGTIFLGTVAEYFSTGASTAIHAGMIIPRSSWTLSVGTRLSLSRAFNNKGVSGGPLWLGTAGLDAGFGTGPSLPYLLSGAVSGGAAFIVVETANGVLAKTAPFADVGIHVGVPLGHGFRVVIDTRLLCIFDSDLPILGIVPMIGISKEF